MARKEAITSQNILDTAFTITREEGFANATARKIATKAGCSTQPIFRTYKNMDELWDAVFEKAMTFFQSYYSRCQRTSKKPFVNLGMSYITFAKEEKHLFELLFTSGGRLGKSMYELLNGKSGNVVYEIHMARVSGCSDPSAIFMKMWIFIHGAACMTLTGDFDLTDSETLKLLEKSYDAFLDAKN